MTPIINIQSASTSALQAELGASIKAQIKHWGKQVDFQVASGIPMNTLHRMMRGETVGVDVLLAALRTLGRYDLLEQMIAEPPKSPLDEVNRKNKRSARVGAISGASKRPAGGELIGVAKPVARKGEKNLNAPDEK